MAAIIYLGAASLRRSRGQPGSANGPGALLPYSALLRVGFARLPCLQDTGALLPHHFTLTHSMQAVCFCCTFRRLAPPRRYLAPLPGGVRTFLDSAQAPRRDRPAR